jgi:glycosyltransferase involved in cell wall biosynthesis
VDYRCRHGILEGRRNGTIVFVGNLKKHKGIETLLRAFQLLRDRHHVEAQLLVIGNIDFRCKDSRVLKTLQDGQGGVTFLQHAANREVFDALRQASVLVSPSLYEGMGLPPLEAMYLGTPAIVSDIPVYREIYTGSSAQFFPPGDAEHLARLLARQLSASADCHADVERLVDERYNFPAITDKILTTIIEYTKEQRDSH